MVQSLNFNKILFYLIVANSFFSPSLSLAETLFEGYSLILTGKTRAGFVVQNYSVDQKAKVYTSTYYIKTNALGGDMTESLSAKCNMEFEPISYKYTSIVNKKAKTIDATFKGSKEKGYKMKAVISENGQPGNPISLDLPKETILSTFLAYWMLAKGVSVSKPPFNYNAVAEEDAKVFPGVAKVQKVLKVNNIDSYRILNSFKGTRFISVMTQKGEVLSTQSPVQQIETQLVKSPVEATQGFTLDSKSLKILFGKVPSGNKHQLASE